MPLQIQINIQADEAGDFTEREQTVLAALTGSRADQLDVLHQSLKPRYAEGLSERDIAAHEAGHKLPAHVDAPSEGFPSSDQAEETLAAHEQGHTIEPEKPKRTRRTKAQIEADRKAEEEGSTGAAVLEDLGDPDPQEDPAAESEQDAETDAAQVAADLDAKLAAKRAEEPKLEATAEKTPADALARAAVLVETEAGQKLVFAALAKVGVERVSLMTTNEQATQFLAEVGA